MPIAKVGDINIEYYVEGSGPPLLMIMGLGFSGSAWSPMLAELRRHIQVVRFSNRGTGLTDKPDAEYSISMMADDAAGLLGELGIGRAHVLGGSMGGMIAQELALNHPQRVQGLVMFGTTCGTRGVQPETRSVAALLPTPGLSRQEQIRKAWSVMVSPEFLKKERDALETAYRDDLENPAPSYAVGRQAMAVMRFDSYERLAQIQAPTLIMHGEKDQLVPVQNARILHERIPNSTLLVLPGAPHGFGFETPKESAQAIVEFLSSVPTAV
jgi:pimeloyl-ACP methyl ester carboxylesterase